ncbi:MAG: ribosome small subunit-dependent GTPase, partial [Gammaproteobacteria bacterium]|nr:ribosome small subunit-dependent GTPase [Gammaproteobacteria bacterium]MBU1655724.1 ribosome small subunit-dependent GTPase [Gammaproteobacteria bacterium]MBU1960096.1 ribosome small subunit-dependent GTPase [Gammaproteobacteria bacterium]
MTKRRLTRQQRERIAHIQQGRREKAAEEAETALASATKEHHLGRVITRHGRNLLVEDNEGRLHHCLFRQNIGHLVCGDEVVWQPADGVRGVVTALRERSSILVRPNYSGHEKPLAANISRMIILLAPEPPPLRYLLDQYLITAENLGIE